MVLEVKSTILVSYTLSNDFFFHCFPSTTLMPFGVNKKMSFYMTKFVILSVYRFYSMKGSILMGFFYKYA